MIHERITDLHENLDLAASKPVLKKKIQACN